MGQTKYKSVAGLVLGIIGTVFSFIGMLYMAVCAAVKDGANAINSAANALATGETENIGASYSWLNWVLGLTMIALALMGAIFAMKNNLLGGIFMGVAAVLGLIDCIVIYWAILMVMAIVLLALGCLLTFLVKKPIGAAAAPAAEAPAQEPPAQEPPAAPQE